MQFQNQSVWESSFEDQIKYASYNTAAVDVLVRNISYYLRARFNQEELQNLHFCEIGCGGGVNLSWLAEKGVNVSGIDISEVALELCNRNMKNKGLDNKVISLKHASAEALPFEDNTFNGVIESCVIQHIAHDRRPEVFKEIHRTLKPGGLFVGHMLDTDSTAFQANPTVDGTIDFKDETKPKFYLTNIGYAHFFTEKELRTLLSDFSVVDLSKAVFKLPREEAARRGFEDYTQSMWVVYAIK